MLSRLLVVALALGLAGCASFSTGQQELIREATEIGAESVEDPMFAAVADHLDANGDIEWGDERIAALPEAGRPNPTNWLLSQYEQQGLFDVEEVRPWIKWYWPWTKTTGVTPRCGSYTRLNILRLSDDEFSIANTLIHERAHTFCHIHPDSQSRPDNICDAAYVLGDLAEVLARHRRTGMAVTPRQELCPKLYERLSELGLVATDVDA